MLNFEVIFTTFEIIILYYLDSLYIQAEFLKIKQLSNLALELLVTNDESLECK